MNFNNANALLCENAYSVQLKFYNVTGTTNGKVCDYLCDIPGVQVGDDVVVLAPDFETQIDKIPKTCRVVSVDTEITVDLTVDFEYQWVLSKIDYTAYIERQEAATRLSKQLTASKRKKMQQQIVDFLRNEAGIDILTLKANHGE